MQVKQSTIHFNFKTGKYSIEQIEPEMRQESELDKQVEEHVIGIYPSYEFQIIEGFGCAMTESACYLLSQMNPETRKKALCGWFADSGIAARFVRIHIDSCDYALSQYQAVEDPLADPELNSFTIERDKEYIIPIMNEVLEITGKRLSVLLSPWSPPAQWKSPPELSKNDMNIYGGMFGEVDFSKSGRCFGGRLKEEFYGSWAKYLVKYVQAYLEEGIPVTMLSVQNEANAATMWDSCVWSGEQEKHFLRDYLYPQMKAAGLTERVGLYIWDHNKERMVEHIDAVMDETIMDMVQGFAYHWYTGDHFEVLSILREKYPDKVLLRSEGCGIHLPGSELSYEVPVEMRDQLPDEIRKKLEKNPNEVDFEDAVRYAHDMIGDMNHGMQRWIDWSMIMDRKGGPRHVPCGFTAPLIAESDGGYTETISFAYVQMICRTVRLGAVRIGASSYDSELDLTAVRNTDGTIGILLQNRSSDEREVSIRIAGNLCTVILPVRTLSSLIIS